MSAGMMARFVSKIAAEGECLVWIGGRFSNGYGKFKAEGKNRYAHRMAWVFERGPIPAGASVLHRCDNRPCVRIEHLFLGTPAINAADMVAKGRAATGDHNGSRLYPERLRRGRRPECSLPGDLNPSRLRPETRPRGEAVVWSKLDESAVRLIRSSGESYNALAARYGVTKAAIRKVKKRLSWRHVG